MVKQTANLLMLRGNTQLFELCLLYLSSAHELCYTVQFNVHLLSKKLGSAGDLALKVGSNLTRTIFVIRYLRLLMPSSVRTEEIQVFG